MPRPSLAILLVASLLTACGHAPLAGVATPRAAGLAAAKAVPGRLIVRWKRPDQAAAVLRRLGVNRGEALGPEGLARDGGAPEALDLPAGVGEEELRAAAGDALDWAEPDRVLRLVHPAEDAGDEAADAAEASRSKDGATSRDPRRKGQWAMDKIHIDAAWRVTRGRPDVRVAIVDTGADLGHPDLRGQIADSYRANGWLGRLGITSAKDDSGHGTHCAGIVAAAADNGEGVAGVAPGCKLLIAKALDRDGAGATSDVVRGIRWAVGKGARVISMSMGGEEDPRALREAVADAIRAGVVVVAAMGNEGKQLKNYPAAYPGVIAVGATTKADKVAGFSTRGSWISVSAPGASILSTTPTYAATMNSGPKPEFAPGYGTTSGTSMATPLVAGLAALLLSKDPRLTPAQVKAAIERGAVPIEGGGSKAGRGRVDAARTLGGGREEE